MSNHNSPYYSDKYTDDKFEYRHVHIPREWVKALPKDRTMTEQEWRDLGESPLFNPLFYYRTSIFSSFRCPTIAGMGALYDSRARTSCSPLPSCTKGLRPTMTYSDRLALYDINYINCRNAHHLLRLQ